MVKLQLLSYSANQNSRFFPVHGFLGLTQLVVDVVRTKLEQLDKKPLQASSVVVAVKCIEARLGRLGVIQSNVLASYSHTLWSATDADNDTYADLGDAEFPFRVAVPVDTPGFSSVNFQDYRVFWRVEAVVSHAPIFAVGNRIVKSYEIPLLRHDLPRAVPPHILHADRFLYASLPAHPHAPSSPAPLVRYQLLTPATPVGPNDIVHIPLTILPLDRRLHVRSIMLFVERKIDLLEPPSSSRPMSAGAPVYAELDEGTRSTATFDALSTTTGTDDSASTIRAMQAGSTPSLSTASLLSSSTQTATLPSDSAFSSTASLLPLHGLHHALSSPVLHAQPQQQPQPDSLAAKTITTNIAAVDAPGPFPRVPIPSELIEVLRTSDDTGHGRIVGDDGCDGCVLSTLSFQWPAAKSHAHWAVGETITTDLVRVRFWVRTKVIVSTPTNPACSLELQPREIFLVSLSADERERAIAESQRKRERSSSHSKEKRRAKREASSPVAGPSRSPKELNTKSRSNTSASSLEQSHSASPYPSRPASSTSISPSPASSREGGLDDGYERLRASAGPSLSPKGKGKEAATPSPAPSSQTSAATPKQTPARSSFGLKGFSRRPHTTSGMTTDTPPPLPSTHLQAKAISPIPSSWGLASSTSLNQARQEKMDLQQQQRKKASTRPKTASGAAPSSSRRPGTSAGRGSSGKENDGGLFSPTPAHAPPAPDMAAVRAWEAELARIENKSRRESRDMGSKSRARRAASLLPPPAVTKDPGSPVPAANVSPPRMASKGTSSSSLSSSHSNTPLPKPPSSLSAAPPPPVAKYTYTNVHPYTTDASTSSPSASASASMRSASSKSLLSQNSQSSSGHHHIHHHGGGSRSMARKLSASAAGIVGAGISGVFRRPKSSSNAAAVTKREEIVR